MHEWGLQSAQHKGAFKSKKKKAYAWVRLLGAGCADTFFVRAQMAVLRLLKRNACGNRHFSNNRQIIRR